MRIALHGFGKMGKAVEIAARARGHEISVTFTKKTRPSSELLSSSDVVIDFALASSLEEIVDSACDSGVNLVIGTTGWSERLNEIRRRCESAGIGVVYAANFSPGANIAFALARRAGELIAPFDDYATGLEERHHGQKKDAPSGTAIRIADEVERGSSSKLRPEIVASRVGSEFGLHTLFFDSPDDLIEISHRARGRSGFAKGAVIAAETLAGKTGFFRFDELVSFGSH